MAKTLRKRQRRALEHIIAAPRAWCPVASLRAAGLGGEVAGLVALGLVVEWPELDSIVVTPGCAWDEGLVVDEGWEFGTEARETYQGVDLDAQGNLVIRTAEVRYRLAEGVPRLEHVGRDSATGDPLLPDGPIRLPAYAEELPLLFPELVIAPAGPDPVVLAEERAEAGAAPDPPATLTALLWGFVVPVADDRRAS